MSNYKKKAEIKKEWPTNCVWPEPVEDGEGHYWESEFANSMPLDEIGEVLQDIKDYMDSLVEEGRLKEDYSINSEFTADEGEEYWGEFTPDKGEDEKREFTPDKGEEYWGEEGFDFYAWDEDMVSHLNNLKLPLPSPVADIQRIIGYDFVNENILRQAFTRRAFTIEYGTGNSEVLEFYGDSVLHTVITREMARHTSDIEVIYPCEPFTSDYDEGELTKLRQYYSNKEYLAARAAVLGLDKYILYGTGEERSESALEDMMEALIGAVAVDSKWDWYTLESVVDRLLTIQFSESLLKTSYYDLFNSWHQKHFGRMPEYEVSKGSPIKISLTEYLYTCTLRYSVPENDKGIWTSQKVVVQRETRSMARNRAAEEAYYFLANNGLWINLKDAHLDPKLDESINQLQELYQKKYVEQPEYTFYDEGDSWRCNCICNGVEGWGKAKGKTEAKKKASFMVLIRLMMTAGLATEEMIEAMYKTMEGKN